MENTNTSSLGPHPKYAKSVQPGIPRLRQPKPKWETVRIGQLFQEISRPVDMGDNRVYDLVTVKRSRGGVEKRESLKGKQIAVKSQFYVKTGDFLISKRQIVHGACGFVPPSLDGAIVSNEYSVLHCTDLILPEFLNYLIHTKYFQQTCFHSSIGVHVEKMIFKLDNWFRWKINIPIIEEQRKIADFLGAVDSKLDVLRCKRDLLADYKRGVMQKFFTQEIRFTQDDGRPFADWEMVEFGQIANRVSKKFDPTKSTEEHLLIELENLDSGNGKIIDIKTTEDQRSIKTCFSSGDVLFGKLRPYLRKFAFVDFSGVCSSEIWVLRTNKTNKKYLYYLIQTERFNRAANVSSGSKMPRADWDIVSSTTFRLPSNKKEQQKIADVLTAIDDKITAVDQQIDQIETFKKGLLQQMFC